MLDFFDYVCYNGEMSSRKIAPGTGANSYYQPTKCWVGDQQKICYATREEAEAAALVAQHDYGAPKLDVYECEYGNHWHLSSHHGR